MIAVGLKVLKNKLSEYVRRASSGETILITDREQVVAELVPPRATRADSIADAVLADAVREGLLSPAALAAGPLPDARAVGSLADVLGDLATDREDR